MPRIASLKTPLLRAPIVDVCLFVSAKGPLKHFVPTLKSMQMQRMINDAQQAVDALLQLGWRSSMV